MRRTVAVVWRAALIIALLGLANMVFPADSIHPLPLALYGVGGAADVWSTRWVPAGYHLVDRSPFGPVAGPVVTSAAFASADCLLQASDHRGWAKVLRLGYLVGVGRVVWHNRRIGGRK
jgi:hypothetical protein